MVEKIAYMFDAEDPQRTSFLQVRLTKRATLRKPKVQRKKDGDKNLRYADCPPDIQAGLRKTRVEEWQKWQKFNAGVVLSTEEVKKLLAEGVTVQPMQWVETDKNAHKRRNDKHIAPLLKSRLVGCGNFEDTDGLRTDSPTSDVDAHNLVFSWCASNKVRIHSADISNAYLQGKEVDRVILYRIPKGGIPECGISEGTVIAARVPIYGTKDAGRGFWLRLKEVVLSHGYEVSRILPTLFSLRRDGEMVGIMSSNVDDLLYGSKNGCEKAMENILKEFAVRETHERDFRFCGKEIHQSDDYSITVTAKDNTEKICGIVCGEKKRLVDKCDDKENTALRSVVASLAWIARQVRPTLSYRVSKLQSICGKATIKDVRECNHVLDYALKTSHEGIHFKSTGLNWDDMVVCTITDASFAGEKI